jgi:starch phosphorylase
MLQVSAEVYLNDLKPDDVSVEIFYGDLDRSGQIPHGSVAPMDFSKALNDGVYRFEGGVPCQKTGQQGFTVRVLPYHPDESNKHETTLITWA